MRDSSYIYAISRTIITSVIRRIPMAKNGPKGHGRKGRIKQRSQLLNPRTKRYIARDASTGRFMNVKSDHAPFKDIRIER